VEVWLVTKKPSTGPLGAEGDESLLHALDSTNMVDRSIRTGSAFQIPGREDLGDSSS
jgi:hypothetical protein